MSGGGARSALVFGGGLAGGHIAAALVRDRVDVVVVDREQRAGYLHVIGAGAADDRCFAVRGLGAVLHVLEERAWDVVVWCLRPNDETADLHELGAIVAAADAMDLGVFVYLSSLAVYGPANDGIGEEAPLRPTSPYGDRKAREEEAVVAASGRLPILILRLTGLFGPLPDRGTGSRSARAVASVVEATIRGEDPVLRVERHRDQYLYSGDLAGVLRAIVGLSAANLPQVVNVGPGYGLLPEEVKAELQDILGTTVRLEVVPDHDEPVGVLDIARLGGLVPVKECMLGFQRGVHDTKRAMATEVRP